MVAHRTRPLKVHSAWVSTHVTHPRLSLFMLQVLQPPSKGAAVSLFQGVLQVGPPDLPQCVPVFT